MFNLAGVFIEQVLVETEDLVEQAFGQAMPADDVLSPRLPARSEGECGVLQTYQAFLCHQQEGGAVARELRQGIGFQDAMGGVFLRVPYGLQQVIDQLLLVHWKSGDLRQAPVVQFDAALGHTADFGVVRDQYQGVAGAVQFRQQAHHQGFVHFVEIAGGLVGKNQVGLIDERPRHAHALLLASGKLRGQMLQAAAQADAAQRLSGFPLVRKTVEVLRQHNVFERREIGNQVELLKDKADFLSPKAGEFVGREAQYLLAIEHDAARRGSVEAAEDIEQRALARAGRAHHGDPLAFLHGEGDLVQRVE